MGLFTMKLKNFIRSSLCQVALASILVTGFSITSAVELTGTPVPVGGSGKVQQNNQADGHAIHSGAVEAEHISSDAGDNKPSAVADETVNKSAEDKAIENKGEESLELIKEHNRHMEAMSRPSSNTDSNSNSMEILIPITAISFSIGGAILLIIVLARLHYRDRERRAQNINANIERLLAAGRDIPIELLRGDDAYTTDGSVVLRDNINLHKGLKHVCLGAGLFAFLSILCGIQIGAVGFILIGLGISQLLVWKLSGAKTAITKGQE